MDNIEDEVINSAAKPKTRRVLLYMSGPEQKGSGCTMRDGVEYIVGEGGNFIRANKDTRTRKQRKSDAQLRRRAAALASSNQKA